MSSQRLLQYWLVAIYTFLYLPVIILILFSFDESRFATTWTGFTCKWYQQLFTDKLLLHALANSLYVACIAVFFSAIMGTMAALGLTRYKLNKKRSYVGLLMLPIIVPEIAMAISCLVLYKAMGIELSLATVIISHIVFCVSYVALVVMARLEGMDTSLEEVAYDLGATPKIAFFKITLPLIFPGIFAGSLLAFILSLDDFVITQFTAGIGNTTIPLKIFSMVKFGVCPEINALSAILILVTTSLAFIANHILQQQKNIL